MGKGYNNFMSKKGFHPSSFQNQKRIHEAEARAEAKKKHDEETLAQYLKEQELFNQKSLVSKQSKEKLQLSFMYEAPPGVKKPDEKQNDNVEWKGTGGASSSSSYDKKQTLHKSLDKDEPTICLEWKREKPVKRPTQDQQSKQQEPSLLVKKEPKLELKVEPKVEPKTEYPSVDLRWKRERTQPTESSSSSRRSSEKYMQDTKRIKKER